tara:strand:+ start:282 stop:1937 length:1656 start_codon:yes stop_codon:yes gene_type:complete
MTKPFVLFDTDSLKDFHKRIFFSMLMFLLVYFGAIFRITEIMLFKDTQANIISNSNDIKERGKIFDRNGNLLATSIISNSLSVNPNKIKNKYKLSKELSYILKIEENTILKKLQNQKKFVWIKRNITPKEHQKIIELGEINLNIHNERKRIYPYFSIPSHIVGYVNIDGVGQAGIERSFENELKNSKDVILTLDINLQDAVREKLTKTINTYRAESGVAIIMDIEKGEILSSVSLPDFDPNNNKTFIKRNLINRVIQSNYEMGSTFKPITAVMGFDKNLISPEMKFNIKNSIKGINDYTKYEGDGNYNTEKIIVHSSNIGAAKIASHIGKKNQIDFFKKIGFFDRLNFELKEAAKPLGNKNNWGEVETMTIGYGHGFAITPLHLVKAYASIANNGFEVNPTLLLRNKINYNKKLLLKKESSEYFLKLLRSVVRKTKFTGPRVKINGYDLGGKTGTAMIVNQNGGYYKDRDLTSFISIFPIKKPKYLVLTILEYPKEIDELDNKTTGAWVNAPLVKEIILEMINILKIPKQINQEILKVDIKHIYKTKNVTF